MLVHYLTNACTVHVINQESKHGAMSSKAATAAQECLDMLGEVSAVWDVAKKSIAIIEQLKSNRRRNEDVTESAAREDGTKYGAAELNMVQTQSDYYSAHGILELTRSFYDLP
jgi:hypothetical protein